MAASATETSYVDPEPLLNDTVLHKRDVVVALTVPAPSVSALLARVGSHLLGKHESFSYKPVHDATAEESAFYSHVHAATQSSALPAAPLRTLLLSQVARPVPDAAAPLSKLLTGDSTDSAASVDIERTITEVAESIMPVLAPQLGQGPFRPFAVDSGTTASAAAALLGSSDTRVHSVVIGGLVQTVADKEGTESSSASSSSTAAAPSAPSSSSASSSASSVSSSEASVSKRKAKRRKSRKVGASRSGPLPGVVTVSLRAIERLGSDGTMTIDEIWDAVLPPASEVQRPSAFEAAGRVARMNLSPEQWPWRRVIGECLLMRHGALDTVVAKTEVIGGASVFRTLPLEIVAGKGIDKPPEPLWVRLRESGCVFELDYRAVYWNSRLSTEHRRLSDDIVARALTDTAPGPGPGASSSAGTSHAPSAPKPTSSSKRARGGTAATSTPASTGVPDTPINRVLDLTCGVGPFAVPLCRAGLWVRANDLNPASVAACAANGQRNGVRTSLAAWGGWEAVQSAARDAAESLVGLAASRAEDAEASAQATKRAKPGSGQSSQQQQQQAGGERRERPWEWVSRPVAIASSPARLTCTCEDAGAAVRRAGGTHDQHSRGGAAWPFAVAVSNLPDRGVRVLSSFRRAIDPSAWDLPRNGLPRICIYCFARSEGARPTVADVEAGVRRRVAMALDPAFHAACVSASRASGLLSSSSSSSSESSKGFGGLVDDGTDSGEMLLDDVPAYKPESSEPALPEWAASPGVVVRGVRDVSPRKLMVLVEIESPPKELVCLPSE